MTKNFPDPQYLQDLAEILSNNALTEIEIRNDDSYIRLGKDIEVSYAAAPAAQMPTSAAAATPASAAQAAPVTSSSAAPVDDPAGHPGVVTSPMVGIVYTRPDPEAEDFITVGAQVSEGDTILLLEAMKVFNPVKAPRSGIIKEIFVESGDPVEFGSALVIIE